MMKILGIAGSLREASSSRGLLRAAQSLLPDGAELVIHELHDLPMFNVDLESDGSAPAAVQQLRAAIDAADAVLFVNPEYNHGVSGPLKNAIDWASRPAFESSLAGKRTAVIGVSGSPSGGPRGLEQTEQALRAVVSRRFPYRELLIGRSGHAIKDGALADGDVERRVRRYLAAFVDWLRAS
jgi:chromate reductase